MAKRAALLTIGGRISHVSVCRGGEPGCAPSSAPKPSLGDGGGNRTHVISWDRDRLEGSQLWWRISWCWLVTSMTTTVLRSSSESGFRLLDIATGTQIIKRVIRRSKHRGCCFFQLRLEFALTLMFLGSWISLRGWETLKISRGRQVAFIKWGHFSRGKIGRTMEILY